MNTETKITFRDIVEGKYKPTFSSRNKTSMDIDNIARDLCIANCYIGWNEEFNERIKGCYLESWMCTDTYVGLAVFYMDDEVIAFSYQSARKSYELFEFVSEEAANKLRQFIISLMDDDDIIQPSFVDLDQGIGPYYHVNYASELLVSEGFYQGELVKIVPGQKFNDYSTPASEWSKLNVEKSDGEIIRIKLEEFDIPTNLHKVEE